MYYVIVFLDIAQGVKAQKEIWLPFPILGDVCVNQNHLGN